MVDFSVGEQSYFQSVPHGTAILCGNEKAIENQNQSNVNTSRNDEFTVSELYEVAMCLPEDQRPRTIYEHRRKCEGFPEYRRRLSWLKRLEQSGRE